jgi:hypothetical protein
VSLRFFGFAVDLRCDAGRGQLWKQMAKQEIDESNFSKMWYGEGLPASKIDKIVQRFAALIL